MSNAAFVETFVQAGDNTLVDQYLAGNEEAFRVLVHRYQNRLIHYLYGMLNDYEMAVDLAQESFIRVYRNASRYKGEYQFSTWIYRIATNLAIDEIRRRERKGRFFFYNVMALFQKDDQAVPLPDRRQCPERGFERRERQKRLSAAIDSLPEKYRLAFILREVQDLTYEETSQVLRISLGTVKSRIHRAKLLLREKLAGVL